MVRCLDILLWLIDRNATLSGSHIVYKLLETRRYKVVTLDNYHNSYPIALKRVSQLALDELPDDASDQDRLSTVIDVHKCDLTKSEEIRRVFDQFGNGGVWGVIHVAVSALRAHRCVKF